MPRRRTDTLTYTATPSPHSSDDRNPCTGQLYSAASDTSYCSAPAMLLRGQGANYDAA